MQNTSVALTRDCEAVQIPAGNIVVLPAGTEVYVSQTLGGTYTVHADGGLFRIASTNVDALGVADEAVPKEGETGKLAAAEGPVDEPVIWETLKTCYDPEIPVNIVDLGLVYDCKLTKNSDGGAKVEVKMTLTAPGCGMGPAIAHDAQSKILSIEGVDEADVQLVWDPPWNQSMISEAGRMKLGMI